MANDLLTRQLRGVEPDDVESSKGGMAVGKRSLTAHLVADGGEPELARGFAYLTEGGGRRGGGDDPFALHLQRKEHGAEAIRGDAPGLVAAAQGGGGQALPEDLRSKFERSLGAELGDVRVHVGDRSATAAEALHARAYTTGNDIHFAAGTYDPRSPDGEHLLAHEVAHTVQQRGLSPASARPQTKLDVSTPGDTSEREADAAADAMVRGRPSAVGPASAATIARDPDKTRMPANQPGGAINAGMFAVKGGEPVIGGTVTADKVGTKVRLTSAEISFVADITMPKPLPDGERVDIGPVQTMLSSSRVGVYREGGRPDGKIVAEQRTDLGEMRDATGEIDKDGKLDQATMPPFYSAPSAFSASTSFGSISFKDKPKAVFPSTVGKGKLTETKGQDSFVTSVTAKDEKTGALLHLKTFKWQLPWGLKLDDGVIQADAQGKSTAQGIATQAAKPEDGIAHNSADIPILAAAGATHMDFQSLDDAMACGAKELLRFLPTATGASRGFIVEALKAKNPMLHITVTVAKKNSSWGKDSVEIRVKGQAQVSRPRVSAGDGEVVAVLVSFNEIFTDIGAINGGSFVKIEAQDRSLVDGKSHRVDWPHPFDGLSGEMNGKDGTYTIVANLGGLGG